jgi:DNA-directed RNA polymerase
MTKLIEVLPTFKDEQANETDMKQSGINRTNKRLYSHIERSEENVTSYGKVMVANTIRPLAMEIASWIQKETENDGKLDIPNHRKTKAFMKVCEVAPEILALITAKSIINTISQDKPLTASAITLGGKVETEIALKNFKTLNPELYQTVRRDLDKRSWNYTYKRRKLKESAKRDKVMQWEEWSTPEKLHVGMRLIELMIYATGMIEIVTENVRKGLVKKTNVIKQTQKTRDWIKERNQFNELLNPEYMPMVMPCKSWEATTGGGYWTKELPELDLVKQHGMDKKLFQKELINFDMPKVYKAVNSMQSTAYKINPFILNVMKEAWDKGYAIGGMPSTKNIPIPNKPLDINTNAVSRKEWKKKAVLIHTENNRAFSKRLLYAKIIYLADKFKTFATIFFPIQLDFRGRAYCVPTFLNYQSINGAKALLNFSKGKPITKENRGVFWLAVHGANMYGEDKSTFEDREKWTKDNEAMIVACAEDPMSNRQWEQGSNSFQFLAFCDEWARYLKEGDGFISHIPVNIDGSCNGLQIYSLMLKDETAGKMVNLLPTDKPQDIYQLVADTVIEKLKVDASNNVSYAQTWLDYGVKRSTTKRPIMTICYGSTRYSCIDFVVDDLTKRKDKGEMHPFENDMFKPAIYLSNIIWASIGNNLKSARNGMTYLQQIAQIMSKEQLPIHWVSPVGFPVFQNYPNMKSKRVTSMLMGEVIKPRFNVETDLTDKLRMKNAVAPNFVHALDSACMMETVNIAREVGIENFCNVHDSYATNACDIDKLNNSVRKAFNNIFTQNDVLQDFKETIKTQLPEHLRETLPDVPEKGSLDIGLLEKAKFFFA